MSVSHTMENEDQEEYPCIQPVICDACHKPYPHGNCLWCGTMCKLCREVINNPHPVKFADQVKAGLFLGDENIWLPAALKIAAVHFAKKWSNAHPDDVETASYKLTLSLLRWGRERRIDPEKNPRALILSAATRALQDVYKSRQRRNRREKLWQETEELYHS